MNSKSIQDGITWILTRYMSDPPISDIDFKNKNGLGLDYP